MSRDTKVSRLTHVQQENDSYTCICMCVNCLCSGVLSCHIWLKWNTFFYRLLTLVLKLEPTTLGTYGSSLSLCLIAVFIDSDIAEKLRTGIGEPE